MKLFGYHITKQADIDQENEVLLQLYRYVNRGIPIPIADNPAAYIRDGYGFNPVVYAVISLRASAAKGVPWLVYKVKNKDKLKQYKSLDTRYNNPLDLQKAQEIKEQGLEEVENSPLNVILDKPNGRETFQDLVEQMFIYRDTTGNAYLYNVKNPSTGKILKMYSLPADRVKIIGGDFRDPVRGFVVDQLFQGELPPENVLHWKYANPIWEPDGRWLYGMSPLRPAASIIAQDNMAIQSQSAAFHNEGLKGIITGTEQTNIDFTPEQAKALRDNFKRQTGYKNKNNIAFNRAPLNFLKIGESPIDLGVEAARRANKDILCNIFRIHPSLLSSEASTLNNLTEARKALMTVSVLPDMDQLKWHLNNMLNPDGTYYIDYDLMAISELQDDLESLGRTLQGMDWITANEKRSATMYDRYENEAADKLYQPFGLTEIGDDMDTGFSQIDNELGTDK